ncbi:MAG: ribose 5-phosphate isomerase B [Hyphomicrobiales bacterium]|nr:ribose 5-phosphate isomerase B [Rickettsiales bacterium]MCP5361133.1 ribose 5-phosphate isomerase B [Hyphomicrobiales bacterium]
MKIAIACDHAGFVLKQPVIEELTALGHKVVDLGTDNALESVDYPHFADTLAASLKSGKAEMGVLLCGSGIGISIAANRHRHIRAALCHNANTATLSRLHNNANVLVMGGRILDAKTARACVRAFFTTAFEGGRHQRRVDQLS